MGGLTIYFSGTQIAFHLFTNRPEIGSGDIVVEFVISGTKFSIKICIALKKLNQVSAISLSTSTDKSCSLPGFAKLVSTKKDNTDRITILVTNFIVSDLLLLYERSEQNCLQNCIYTLFYCV